MRDLSIRDLYSIFIKNPSLTTDSRNIKKGSIFFSLKGDNFDGNKFAEAALQNGCSYAVVDNEEYYKGEKYILVHDCLETLQALAKFHREQLSIPFIAITGSNGKTTTKELIKNILEKKYRVLATQGNLNNHIGVPLTILSVTPETELAVIEMGANHAGEIAMLCEIAQPHFGIITNIGRAHLGEFGSFEAVVKAKTELYHFIKASSGKIFINSENKLLMDNAAGIEKISYGSSGGNFSSTQFIEANPFLHIQCANEKISSQLIGSYNFENVSAAICIGKYFGVEMKSIKEAIENYIPSNNRSQAMRTKTNMLILDAYNANPSSMAVALENFSQMKGENKWLIFGDMLELGEYEIKEHQDILLQIAEKKFLNVMLVGPRFMKALNELKISFPNIFTFKTSDELIQRLKTESPIVSASMILIKGSRGMKLEKAVEYL
ncbi:MAG TPA: UDP-N-acetylmuramoyl-tripeptide--D-alanyl-D-alanine ligase [Bacteroidia bacterium]